MMARLTLHDRQATLRVGIACLLQQGLDLGKWLAAFGLRMGRDWRREILAAAMPFVLLDVLIRGPGVPAALRSDASIGTIATVQGAVTGLSLIALVLAVELARRQEDRDDTVYEIMLRAAWIRPMFTFALAALLATLAAVALADFSAVAQESRAANLLLCAYLLTGSVGVALLLTVLRTVHVLRPTGVIEHRFRANDKERREKVAQFISRAMDEFPKLGPIERLLLPHRPVGLTATERLFAEVDDALQSGQAARFSGALERLQHLIENSAEQIAGSNIGFQPPGQPALGYWFPLDALDSRLGELWRAAFSRQGYDFEREMSSLQYWLVMTGTERRSGELLEIGLRSGTIGYQAAREAGLSSGHARHAWLNLDSSAWWRLREPDSGGLDPASEPFVRRLIEHAQEYGDMLLRVDDADSFGDLLAQFRQSFYDAEEHRWMYRVHTGDRHTPLMTFEYALMALLALGGRAITLKEQGRLRDSSPYLDPINNMVEQLTPIARYVPAACDERETPLRQQWGWWEMDGRDDAGVAFAWIAPEQYPMLPLLLELWKAGSDEPLPALGGHAQRFIEAWSSHKDVILEIADVAAEDIDEAVLRFERRLETAKEAEEREREDSYLASPLDQGRVAQFLARLTADRQGDRVLEACFADVGRVRRLTEAEWGEDGRFASAWRLPRAPFVDDPSYLPLRGSGLVRGFEYALASQLADVVGNTAQTHSSVEPGPDGVLAAIDAAAVAVGDGPKLILVSGQWPIDIDVELRSRAHSPAESELAPNRGRSVLALGKYKGHEVLRAHREGAPMVLVLALDRWGWLLRAPTDSEDFRVRLEEIDSDEAERLASEELPKDANEEVRAAKVRELRLLVRAQAEERTRFEMEDSEAARIIRVADDESDDWQ